MKLGEADGRLRRRAVAITLLLALGCDERPAATGAPAPPLDGSGPTTSSSAAASAAASASATNEPASPWAGKWQGTYVAKRGDVTVPEGVTYKSWESDPGGAEGSGTLAITVLPDGTVTGEALGALGKLVVSGMVEGTGSSDSANRATNLSAGVSPADDESDMHGMLILAADGPPAQAKWSGTLTVSSGDANRVRTASVVLARE